jgi:murein DD-endopeptidase MepM/ murein hydrolase activator NlpD
MRRGFYASRMTTLPLTRIAALLSVLFVALIAGEGPSFALVDAPYDRPAPGVRPVPGAVVRPFDPPAHAYGPGHRGVDLAAAPGSPVRAVRDGRVSWSGDIDGTGWVTVDHGGGLATTYGDLEIAVTAGARVQAGQVLGRLAAARSHLDWGARWTHDGEREYVDPLLMLADLRPVLVASAEGIADV